RQRANPKRRVRRKAESALKRERIRTRVYQALSDKPRIELETNRHESLNIQWETANRIVQVGKTPEILGTSGLAGFAGGSELPRLDFLAVVEHLRELHAKLPDRVCHHEVGFLSMLNDREPSIR